jgi:hypothetical protein
VTRSLAAAGGKPLEVPPADPGQPAKEPPGFPTPDRAPDIPPVRESPTQPDQPQEFPGQSPPSEIPHT